MSNFDLAKELSIANMINALNNPLITGELSNNQILEIVRTISNHIYESSRKMNAPLTNNIAATPTDEAARLWGEDQSYTSHL